MLVTSILILLAVITVAAFVMLRQREAFDNYGSPSEAGNLLLSKQPDVCPDLGLRTDCIVTEGCSWNEATGMCQRSHKEAEGFAVSMPACSTYTDCATCAAADNCGWCKTTSKCLTQDRFGTSGGKCTPESKFSTFPSTCSSDISFNVDSSTLLQGSNAAPAPSSAGPLTLTDTSGNLVMCQRLVHEPMPAVTDPALRKLHKETVAKCVELLASTGTPVTPTPTEVSDIQIRFKMNDMPAIGARIKSDIQRLIDSVGV